MTQNGRPQRNGHSMTEHGTLQQLLHRWKRRLDQLVPLPISRVVRFSALERWRDEHGRAPRGKPLRTMQFPAPDKTWLEAVALAWQWCSKLEQEVLTLLLGLEDGVKHSVKDVAYIQNRPQVAIRLLMNSAIAKLRLALVAMAR